MKPYDDPYSFLAMHIISISTRNEVIRALSEDDFLYRMLIKEVRKQDFSGPFLDAIICDILENKRRMEMCHELDKLSDYFFSKLDLPRLREKIINYADKYGII